MLTRLFGSKTSKKDVATTPKLAPGIQQTILGALGVKSIPVMPGAAQKAFQLATNPKADAHDFIEVIEADEALSARILKVANSVFFDRGNGSKTIPEAVQVIGLEELRGMMNAKALAEMFPSKHKLRATLWAHDIGVALIARLLARRYLPMQTPQAFLAGLMHDVGKLLMLQRHTDTFEKITLSAAARHVASIEAETEEYPFDHTEVGQLIGERWNFTPDLITVIRNHHKPWAEIPANSLVAIVKGANIIGHAAGLGGNDPALNRKTYEDLLPEAWEALRVQSGEQKHILSEAQRVFDTEYELYASWGGG